MISAVILTFNEAPNIKRAIESVLWVNEIVLVDSGSTDQTIELALKYPKVSIYQRPFDNHTNQWNFGLGKANNNWVLSLDADYIITKDLALEIQDINLSDSLVQAYAIPFKYMINGKPLFGTLMPPRLALFNKTKCHYIQDGHTQKLYTTESTSKLSSKILHDDRKEISRWLASQNNYANLEFQKLISKTNNELSFADRIRKGKIVAPFLVFFYTLLFKGCILSGLRGWYYAFQRVYAELLISLKLIEHTLKIK